MATAATAYVERESERFVAEWRELCRIPSVSGDREPIEQAGAWIERRIAPLVDAVRRVEIPGHGPLVIGELRGSGPGRLLLYTHYDVQPPGDLDAWTSPPFSAEVRDGAVYARGACDDKADVTARIQALEAWRATLGGEPSPFTIVFISEPAEEIGSPGLAEALAADAHDLRADACLWESFLRDDDGRPGIGFGCRGNLEVRLDLHLLAADQHTAFATIVRSAPLELMRAVASMIDGDGRIVIDGFHAGALAPAPEQVAAAARIPLPTAAVTRADRRVRPYWSDDEAQLRRRLVFEPSVSVARMVVGADDVGSVPAEASVTLRFSLVPDQEPDRVLAAIAAHLSAHGFSDVELVGGRRIRPASAPLDTPFAHATIEAARDVFGEPIVYPVLIGAGPGRIVLDQLGAPIVSPAGTLRPDGNMHGPDEHGTIADYVDHVRFTTRLFERLAERGF